VGRVNSLAIMPEHVKEKLQLIGHFQWEAIR
jgi:hypothetical protein